MLNVTMKRDRREKYRGRKSILQNTKTGTLKETGNGYRGGNQLRSLLTLSRASLYYLIEYTCVLE
jgi:hypothetical protein